MFKNGGTAEAKWCSLLCGSYLAVEESGVLSKSELKSIRNVNASVATLQPFRGLITRKPCEEYADCPIRGYPDYFYLCLVW